MGRLSKNKLNEIKKQYGVETIYSFSRYNSYLTDPYSYLLTYIKHVPQIENGSIYSKSGTMCHEILQDFLEGKIKYDDMIDKYEEGLFELNNDGYVYSKNDKNMNDNIANKYENSIRHFFMNYKPLDCKWLIEKPILIKVGRFIFIGYIDMITKIGDTYIIEDIKTSTIYTGEKKKKESAQLLLYSLGVSQKFNVPLDKIKARWNFIKYTSVEIDLKTIDKNTKKNKIKTKDCVRSQWVKEVSGDVRKWLKTEGYDELEIEDILQNCIRDNSLDSVPNIKHHFRLSDCYVDIDLSQENIDELTGKIIKTLTEVEDKTETTKEYLEIVNNSDDDEEIKYFEKLIDDMWWSKVDKSSEYYYWNLCNYDKSVHKPWKQYLDDCNMFKKDLNTEDDDDEFNW